MLVGGESFLDWHAEHAVGLGYAQANVAYHVTSNLPPVVILRFIKNDIGLKGKKRLIPTFLINF